MEARNILIYLAIKYGGNYDAIYQAIVEKEDPIPCPIPADVLTILDEGYPDYLKYMLKPPLVLFYRGDISLIKDKKKNLAIIGTRHCTEYGTEATEDIIEGLRECINIVSGFATGIDTCAHINAIRYKHKTIAVLPCGIDTFYPTDNEKLYDYIGKNHLLISEYPGKTPPQPTSFHMRNRLIAYFSQAVLVTEAYARSGTSITVTWALEMGIDVCAIPTDYNRKNFCNDLIVNGAHLIRHSRDVMDVMGMLEEEPLFEL